MKRIYKMKFNTSVHFGNGNLNDSTYVVKSDTIFSALCIEAMKFGILEEFLDMAKSNKLFLSDAMPFVGDNFLVPKPMKIVESQDSKTNLSVEKKRMKKMSYIPFDNIKYYLKGEFNKVDNLMDDIGEFNLITKAAIRSINGKNNEDVNAEPYHVGTFKFKEGSGIYIIAICESDKELDLLDKLIVSLGISGIGGKKNIGFGKFEVDKVDGGDLVKSIKKFGDHSIGNEYVLISTSIPEDERVKEVLEGANYQIEKRSGFVCSETISSEQLRKKDIYLLRAGSYFSKMYNGKILDVSPENGKHSVYRYAKAMFMEI